MFILVYKRKRKATYVPFGPNQLWRACEDIVQGKGQKSCSAAISITDLNLFIDLS